MQGSEEDDEAGQYEEREDRYDDDRHDGYHGGVNQRRRNLASSLHVAIDVVRELVQDDVEVPGQLGGLEDADVEVGEGLGMLGRGDGERVTVTQGLDHVLEDAAHQLSRRLFDDDLESLHDRNPSLHED